MRVFTPLQAAAYIAHKRDLILRKFSVSRRASLFEASCRLSLAESKWLRFVDFTKYTCPECGRDKSRQCDPVHVFDRRDVSFARIMNPNREIVLHEL